MSLKHLTYTDLLRQQDNLEHACTFCTDGATYRVLNTDLSRVNDEIADREAKGLTHISYALGLLPDDMETETPGA